MTPEVSPLPSPNGNSLPPAEEAAPAKPSASPVGRPYRVDEASDQNGNDAAKVAANGAGNGVGGASVGGGGGGGSLDGEPVFGLSVADMRARLQSKKRVDVRGAELNRNFKEKYDIFQKL